MTAAATGTTAGGPAHASGSREAAADAVGQASTGAAGSTAAVTLVRWALGLDLADVPADVQRAATRHLLDGLGTAVAAARTTTGGATVARTTVEPPSPASAAVAVATALGGPPEATVLGTGARVSAPAASLANGTLVHALDFDDTHAGGLVHATSVVLPAALAVGQQVRASGAEVLTAAVAGYETVCRVAAAAPHAFHARGLHATSACGVLAAALVAGRLLRLTPAQAVDALGIAGSSAGGLLEFLATGSSTKQLHPGLASHAGILAARLAAAGASGPRSVLEGRNGVYAALADRHVDPTAVVGGLGERWETTRITIKPYPACQLSHAALDATAAALAQVRGLDPADVLEVRADVHPDSAAIVCEPHDRKLAPRTPYDAKFSLPWSVAALLVDGGVTVATYDPTSIDRPDVRALAARVTTEVVPTGGVAADAPGRVVLRLRDGREVVGAVPGSAGGPERPLDDVAFAAKLAGSLGSPAAADRLTAVVAGMAGAPDVEEVVALADELARAEEPT